ncbi:uncharacterized protein LOC116161569 [Photinus pyralis]|uniref:uncharacterized protein LOC116161569 n=1 Tax=Photinus pyralis TaxID=7054 RepID=UPI0012672501|nr:uncharacterized protein LOC116161569 [Photinus pyralis]
MASRRTSLKVKLFVLVRGMEAHLVKLSAMRLLFVLVGSLFLLDSVSGVTLTIPVEAIFPNNKHMLEQANIFLNKTTDQSKVIIAKELAGLGVPVKAFVLQNLVKASQHAFNDPHAMFEVDLDTLRELIKKYEEYKPTVSPPPVDEPPVDIGRIFPQNPDLQNEIRNFIDRLTKDVKDVVRHYLGNLAPDQQERVLSRLANGVDPYNPNVVLDPETIRQEVERDQRNRATPPPVEEPPVDVDRIFPQDRDLQNRLRDFLNRLAKDVKDTVREYLGNLPPDQQGRVLSRLADRVDPHAQNVKIDPAIIRQELKRDQWEQRPTTDRVTPPPVEEPPVDIDRIFPQDRDLQNKLRDFLNRLAKDVKDSVRQYLGNLPPDQQGRVLSRLADRVDPNAQNVAIDPATIREEVKRDQWEQRPATERVTPPPVDELPVDLDRIFPQDRDLLNRLRDFLNRLAKEVKDLVRRELGHLPPDQQGRVLSRLADGVDPYNQNVVLDPGTIREAIELDQESQRPVTERVTPTPPVEEPPVDIDKIFPQDRDLQNRLRNFLNRLANDVKSFVRYYLGPLPPDQQGRVLGRLADQVLIAFFPGSLRAKCIP